MGRTIKFSYGGSVEELYNELSDKLNVDDVDFQLDMGFFDIFTLLSVDDVRPWVYETAMADLSEQARLRGVSDVGRLFVRTEEIVSLLDDGTYRYTFDRYGSWLDTNEYDFYYDFDEIDEDVIEGYVSKMVDVLSSIEGITILD